MNSLFKILSAFLLLFVASKSQAQNQDSLEVIDSKYDSILSSDGKAMDVLFYKHKHDILINNLGPYGSRFYYPTSFSLYEKSLFKRTDSFNNKIYDLSGFKPFTNITWINAGRKEQLFSIKHVQELGRLIHLNFDFKKLSSPGAYINQEANNIDFRGEFYYQSKRGNYEARFSSLINRNYYEENGGLSNTDDYENEEFDDERTYSVNLLNSNSFFKDHNYRLEQCLDLFKLGLDSSHKKTLYFKHTVDYHTKRKVFFDNDPLSEMYENIIIDSISTIDSVYNYSIGNVGVLGFKSDYLSIELLGEYDHNSYVQSYGLDTTYNNLYAGIGGDLTGGKVKVEFLAKYGVNGYNQGDVESDIAFSYVSENYLIGSDVSFFLLEPELNFVNYTSNHFEWKNYSFDKQSILGANVNVELKNIGLEFLGETKFLTNTLYFDSLASAAQHNNGELISTFSLAKNYKLLNFHFRTAFIYQLTSDKILFPLPDIVGRQILYYQKYIFKGALKFQVGIGASYSTAYYGYSYMPALSAYYVQQHTQLGYYPNIDVFINTHLKRAQIFLKYEHFNGGRSLHKSYASPGYPLLPKSLKFGVSWNMFD